MERCESRAGARGRSSDNQPRPAQVPDALPVCAMKPLEARVAVDEGTLHILADTECESRIKYVAVSVFRLEQKTCGWHDNVSIPQYVPTSLP